MFGTLCNYIGGLLGSMRKNNKENINKIIAFTAGIITSIICFELLIEAFRMASKYYVLIFTVVGCVFIKILDSIINIFLKGKNTSALIVSAMAAHNITEGIVIGAGFSVSKTLGFSILCAIVVHNIPEGMLIGSMLRKEKKKNKNVLKVCFAIGSLICPL